MKICRQCQQSKPETDFYRAATNRDGLTTQCRACKNAAAMAYAQTEQGREVVRRAAARWKERHPGKATEQATEWRRAHPQRARSINARWREANREQQVAAQTRWRAANPDRQKEASARWRANHPEAKPRIRARAALLRAVQRGQVIRPDRCQLCGIVGTPAGHHWNGYGPEHYFDVIWLCRACHGIAHRT